MKKSKPNSNGIDIHAKHKKKARKLNFLLILLSTLLFGSLAILTYLFVQTESAKIDAKNALQQQVEVGNANVVSYVTGYERFLQVFRANQLEFLAIIIIVIAGTVFLIVYLYKDRKQRKYHKHHFEKSHHNEPKPNKIHTISKYRAPWENIWLLLGGVLVVALIGILVLRISRASDEIVQNTANLESSALEAQGYKKIISSAGFSLIYNFNLLDTTAQTTPDSQPISSQELTKVSDYTIVKISPSEADSASITSTSSVQNTDLKFETTADKGFFDSAKTQYGNLSQVELAIRHFAPKNDANNFVEKTNQTEVEISGVKYQAVEYKIVNTEYVTTTSKLTQYVLVVNNQPFSMSLSESSQSIPSQVQLLRNVISSVKYGSVAELSSNANPRLSNVAYAAEDKGGTQTNPEILSQSTTNVPTTLVNDTALQVVAKNQPTVVRVGTNTCMNIDLLLPNGQVGYSAKNACNAVVGSGSIISSDGYISTNGHVVSDIPELVLQTFLSLNTDTANLRSYLQYLVDTGVLTRPQLEALARQIAAGNKQAIEKFLSTTSKISPDKYKTSSVDRKFVIQLSNDPIKAEVNKTVITIPTSDTKVSAQLIDKDFDEQTLRQSLIANIKDLKTSDVAILKLDSGSNYPISTLGGLNEQNNSNPNSGSTILVTAMGFPGFVDGGLTTKKDTTIPSATQGKILGVESIAENKYRLIDTNVPAAQGNSGGPAFAEDGSIIGLVTYVDPGASAKSGKESFATSSILRDVSDVKSLLEKNNITLNTSSTVDSTWDQGIEKFSNAHYKSANQLFTKAKTEYPANYLAAQLSSVAEAKIAAGLDVPEISPMISVLVLLFIILLIVGLVIVIIMTVRHRKKAKSLPPLPDQPINTNASIQPPVTNSTVYTPNTTENPPPQPSQITPISDSSVSQGPAIGANISTNPVVSMSSSAPSAQEAAQQPAPPITNSDLQHPNTLTSTRPPNPSNTTLDISPSQPVSQVNPSSTVSNTDNTNSADSQPPLSK